MELDFKKTAFIVVFVVAGLLASRINFSAVLGAPNQSFTLFQFFAPSAGGLLSGVLGFAVVLAASLVDFVFAGKEATLLNLVRLLPLAFAALYFATASKRRGSKSLGVLAVPLAAIALFLLHPVGQQAWLFAALFWSVPVLARLFAPENLLAKSLGATFTAHAVGSVAWLYLVPTTPSFWLALIPVVVYERGLFAAGTAVSYVAANALFSRLSAPAWLRIDRRLPLAA